MAGLTQQLAQFISTLEYVQLPQEAVDTVKRGAIDCTGVLFAGRDEPVVGILLQSLNPGEPGEARLLFGRQRASAPAAALVNGAAAHALDYDDTGIDGHPSVALVPALLAEGERLGASGRELVTAYVAGYETWAELSSRDGDKHHAKGWHPTAVFGTVAAAAAAARLARLDAARTGAALGIAASMAGGVVANFGSMTKPFQAGRAGQNGILAARLAAQGMTASPDALEHRAGLLHAVSPQGRVRTEGAIRAGHDWGILRHGLNIKCYPVCYALHRSIDAALDLARAQGVRAETVAEVEMRIGRLQASMLRHSRPKTALDAKFSGEFALASALSAGRVGLAELSDGFVASAAVQALIARVKVTPVDEADPEDPLFAPFDTVTLRLADGRVLESERVHHARGHAKRPLAMEELKAKFDDCVGDRLAADARERLFERLGALERLATTADLYA